MPAGITELCFLHTAIRNNKPSSSCTIAEEERLIKYSATASVPGVVRGEMKRSIKKFVFQRSSEKVRVGLCTHPQ